jgi:hypothetical protein
MRKILVTVALMAALAIPAAANLYLWTITPHLSAISGPAPLPNFFGGPNLHQAWRQEMLDRVDAALNELRESNPGHFDFVMSQYGLSFTPPLPAE